MFFVSTPCIFSGNYFKWSSDVPASAPENVAKSHEEYHAMDQHNANDIFIPTQIELRQIFSEKEGISSSLQEQFCDLVCRQFDQQEGSPSAPLVKVETNEMRAKFASLKSEDEEQSERVDGVLRSRDKFGKSKPVSRIHDTKSMSSTVINVTKE